jgi:hypothetical protein
MRPVRFLLINPTSPLWRVERPGAYRGPRTFRFSMLSSLYVAAAAPPNVETRIIDEDVEPVDFDADVDLVGLSFMTFNAPRAYEIADEFRRRGRRSSSAAIIPHSCRKRPPSTPTPSASVRRRGHCRS